MSKQIKDFPAAGSGASTDKYLIQTVAGVTSYILKSIADAIITVSNKLILANGAEIRVDGDNIGWEDDIGEIIVRGSGVNDPTWAVVRDNLYAFQLSASTMNQFWRYLHLKHDWHPGSVISMHLHLIPTTTTATGTMRFGMEYSYAKGHDQANFPASTTVYTEYTFAANKQYRHLILEFPDITNAAFEVDGAILLRIFRDATHVNDTFADPISIMTADAHYQKSRFATKNKAPNFYV